MRTFWLTFASLAALAVMATAQTVRPGLDRPIRVGMFGGTGTGGSYWSTNTHTAFTVVRDMLARPDTAKLGDSLVIPPAGFTFYRTTLAWNSSTMSECAGPGCGPDATQIAEFVSALDTLDVMVMNNVVSWSSRVTSEWQRAQFQNFWRKKGYVAIQNMADMRNDIWEPLDSIHGARLRGWAADQTFTIRRDSVFMAEPAWRQLNKGVFPNGLDTSFFERPIYFTESGITIRARAHVKPTMTLVEASVMNPGVQTPMGDHPYSWYRELPEGGRFFYTALGHRAQVWENTRTFRRQLYNAILWAAGADSTGVVSVRKNDAAPVRFTDAARISFSGPTLAVSILYDEKHTVEVRSLDGRFAALRRGTGRADHRIEGLRPGVYTVSVTAGGQRVARLVTTP